MHWGLRGHVVNYLYLVDQNPKKRKKQRKEKNQKKKKVDSRRVMAHVSDNRQFGLTGKKRR